MSGPRVVEGINELRLIMESGVSGEGALGVLFLFLQHIFAYLAAPRS